MKPHFKPLATAFAATLQLAALAAVPLAWDVRPGQPAPASFDRYHGEALEFRCTFRGFGELPFAPGADIRLWYQTNGMGYAWWSAPATIQSNVLSATWSPELDPGADRVSLFFGAPSNAYASAVLRLRHSPGFAPGAMPDPETFHESDPLFSSWLSAFQESDPVFSSWLSTFEVPDTSLEPSTNYTDRVVADFARTNGVVSGGPYLALTGGVLRAQGGAKIRLTGTGAALGGMPVYVELAPAGIDVVGLLGWNWLHIEGHGFRMNNQSGDGGLFSFPSDAYETGGTIALRSDIPPTTDLTPLEQDIADLRTESSLVYRLYSGSNVVAEVTNYNSQVHAPALRIMQLNDSNEYITVWTETNGLARTLADARQYTDGATNALPATFAPRAWGRTTSGLGFDAPGCMTWVSTSNLVIAGGLEYEKHVTSGGVIWLLESNGMTADFHASSNNTAYLDISDADGTSIFRIEKTDAFLVGVNVNDVTVDGDTLVCVVNVVATEHPLVRVKSKLSDESWAKEEDGIPSSLATVAWSGTAGNWTCRITNNTGGNSLFAQMEYLQEGGTKIVNTAPIDVTPGILCTDGVHKCRPVYSNGSITWEVVP
jgi:hypothetical protein